MKPHHNLWSEGTGRWSAAMAVVDRLGSSARRAPSTGSWDTDLLGSRAIGQLRPATCEKSPHPHDFLVGGQQNIRFSSHTSNLQGFVTLKRALFRRAMSAAHRPT